MSSSHGDAPVGPAVRLSLTVLTPRAGPGGRNRPRQPRMPRAALRRLTGKVMRAVTMRAAVRTLLDAAATTSGDWHRYTLRLAEGLAAIGPGTNTTATPFPVFVTKGNTKLPFTAFGTLPEFTCPGAGECLKWCYSFASWRYPAAWARQLQNTVLLKFAPHVVAHHFGRLGRDTILRLYVDGDLDSARTVAFWFDLLKGRPDLKVYGYSKSWALLWEFARENELPDNYRLNLSSGGKDQGVTVEQIRTLPITRGEFIAVPVDYRPGRKGGAGFGRFADPEYHRAVRRAALEQLGLDRVLSCPGKCGECCGGRHACGSDRLDVAVVTGIH